MEKPSKETIELLNNLLGAFKRAPTAKALRGQLPDTETTRLRKLADEAAWLSTDPEIPFSKRRKYHLLARSIDILTDGHSNRPSTFPSFRVGGTRP